MAKQMAKSLKALAKKHSKELLFIPLGGMDEIGMNAYLYHYKGSWILIDAGLGFADYRLPGVDTLFPDFRFFEDFPLDAVLITHGHEDHIGALAELLQFRNVPLYMGEFTEKLVMPKLTGFDKIDIHRIKNNCEFTIGKFTIMPCMVSHSIPEAFAFFLKCDFGLVVHSGDWKYDENPVVGKAFAISDWKSESGKIKAMICDSTNVTVAGDSGSEGQVRESLTDIIAQSKGHRIFITCFASNVARLNNIMHAAHKAGRKVLLQGRAMHRIYQIGSEMGFFDDLPAPLDEEKLVDFEKKNLVIIVTGSQGEKRSMLAKIVRGENKKLSIKKGDKILFSSRTIPGNEISIGEVQNLMAEQGGEIVDIDDNQFHVSGHYQRDEISDTYTQLRPQWVIPIHGEARHRRAHCKLATDMQIKAHYVEENGGIAIIGSKGVSAAEEKLSLEIQMLEPNGQIITKFDKAFGERKKFVWNGALVMALAVHKDTHILQTVPQITAIGIGIDDDLLEDIEDEAADIFEKNSENGMAIEKNIDSLKTLMRKKSRQILRKQPIIAVNLLQV